MASPSLPPPWRAAMPLEHSPGGVPLPSRHDPACLLASLVHPFVAVGPHPDWMTQPSRVPQPGPQIPRHLCSHHGTRAPHMSGARVAPCTPAYPYLAPMLHSTDFVTYCSQSRNHTVYI